MERIICENCGGLPLSKPATKKCESCKCDYCEECFEELKKDAGGCVVCSKPVTLKANA